MGNLNPINPKKAKLQIVNSGNLAANLGDGEG
jgi:hypothetical protein